MTRILVAVVAVLLCTSVIFAGPYGPGAPSKAPPPQAPGEYRIKDAEGKTKYIGETNNLQRRKEEHERDKIKQHQPYENKSKGGEGRKK